MLDSKLIKHYHTYFLKRLLPLFYKLKPLTLTFIGTGLGILTLPALAFSHSYLALTLLLVSGLFDTLDGVLARHKNTTSDLGAACDICSDRLVESAVLIGLYLNDTSRALAVLLMFASVLLCITSFLVVGIFEKNASHKSFHYSTGLMERTEAFIFFTLMILIPNWFYPLAYLFTGLVTLTAIIRLNQFRTSSHVVVDDIDII